MSFRVGGESSARAYLPVELLSARVVAIDAHGRPAIVSNELGRGRTVFCTYPLEHFAARTPRVNPESTWRLYSALAEVAGVSRPVRVDDPRVLVGRLRGGRSETAILVNVSGDDIAAEPLLEEGVELETDEATVVLEPFGVAVLGVTEVAARRRRFRPTRRRSGEDRAVINYNRLTN